MRLEWAQNTRGTCRLKRYVADGTFQWAGKVWKVAYNDTDWMGNIHRTGEYHAFASFEEAKAWVEVVVRMKG